MLSGPEGNEPEGSIDGAEFASSGEAEAAPRAETDDFDIELTEDAFNRIAWADAAARELETMNYGNDFTEREDGMNYVGPMSYEAMKYAGDCCELHRACLRR